jgi:hypothetical protein
VQEDGALMISMRRFVWSSAKHDEEQPATAGSLYAA